MAEFISYQEQTESEKPEMPMSQNEAPGSQG